MTHLIKIIDLISLIRKISQKNLPVTTSFIPYDILVYLYKAYSQQQQVNLIIDVETMKAFDKIFLEFGCDEKDISRAVKELDLLKSEEYITLVKEMQAKRMAAMQ